MGNNKSLGHRILHFPLTKMLIGIIVCAIAVLIAQLGFRNLIDLLPITQEYKDLWGAIILATLSLIGYAVLYKYYEKRKITELSSNRLTFNISLGLAFGLAIQSLTIFVIYVNGSYSVIAVNGLSYLIPSLTLAFASAFLEEVLFRGIIFRLTEEKLGSYIALAVSALIFGGLHIANPNSSIVAGLGLSIQAGILLGAAYMYTRSLWFPIALHFAWNFAQSGIFGANTSGVVVEKSLLTVQIEGAEIITGGQFGPEGSIQATLFGLTAAIILMILNHRCKNIIKPFWLK